MKPILLALALVFTVLSSFLPYSSELMLRAQRIMIHPDTK